ncbi:hypothetical protein [Paenibacillus pinihumi]|uniref:hypothetical protein n=1 Tax=Paenibacillus pinihumi TaxID=669462 RepID=UPI000420CC3E|nr:hypothetical protein [Paenibacillus pinihumi]
MYICFVEYKIDEEYMETYRAFMKEKQEAHSNMHIYEGTDQPGLFVELWQAASEAEAQRIKEERCNERSSFMAARDWISGGSSRLHAWVFKPF